MSVSTINPVLGQYSLFEIPKNVTKVQNIFEFGQSVVEVIQSGLPFVEKIAGKIPTPVERAVGATSFYSGAFGIFALPNLISDIYKAVTAPTLTERVKNCCRAVINAGACVTSAVAIVDGLKSVAVIAKDALKWTQMVTKALIPLQVLSLGVSSYEFHGTYTNRQEILSKIKAPRKERQIEDLTEACNYVIQNKEQVRKILVLSKKTAIDVKAERIIKTLTSYNEAERKQALQEGEEMIKIMRRRMNTKLGLEATALAFKVAGVAAACFTVVAPTSPISLAVAGICGVASIGLFALEKILLNKDPFSKPGDKWYEKAAHHVRQFIYKSADCIETVANQAVSGVKEAIDTVTKHLMTPIEIKF